MKKVKSSTASGCVGAFLFAACIAVVLLCIPDSRKEIIQLTGIGKYFLFMIGLVIFMGLVGFRTYYLTQEEILHYWLGIHYKSTKWEEIGNISRIIIPRRGSTLWITLEGRKILPIEPDGILKTNLHDEFRNILGDYFSLFDKPEILDYIKEYYGPLDYDYKTDRTVF